MNTHLRPARLHPCMRGFSLVEILAGVVIVAILATLITSGYRVLLKSADSAKCMNNLRTLAAAGRSYANDHNGSFTHRRFMHSMTDAEEPGLREYVGITQRTVGIDTVFTCPALQRKYPITKYAENRNYVINRFATMDYTSSSRIHKTLTAVPRPSSMAYLMDGTIFSENDGGDYAFNTHIVPQDTSLLLYPHSALNHVAFLDGHVEALSRAQIEERNSNKDTFWTGGEL